MFGTDVLVSMRETRQRERP